MKALVYHGPGQKSWEEVAKPTLQADTDAIVRVDATTICGTDLHIMKGDVPAVPDGRILGTLKDASTYITQPPRLNTSRQSRHPERLQSCYGP